MNNDGQLATGVSGDSMFANNQPDETSSEAERKQQADFLEILPTAEKELELIDQELSRLNTLTDFYQELSGMATDKPMPDIRAKLDARLGYVNYLLARRSHVLAVLESANKDISEYPLLPAAFTVPVREVATPRPHGWRAIAAGIADLFRRKPMQ